MVSITVVDGVPLPAGEEFTGVIRTQDVRATEKDKVKIGDCFRGGDVVKGLVVCCFFVCGTRENELTDRIFRDVVQISLGDARSYYITTSRNDLGVIFATSEAGETSFHLVGATETSSNHTCTAGGTMEPVSWQEMRCPKTGKLEKRKCAKPEGL